MANLIKVRSDYASWEMTLLELAQSSCSVQPAKYSHSYSHSLYHVCKTFNDHYNQYSNDNDIRRIAYFDNPNYTQPDDIQLCDFMEICEKINIIRELIYNLGYKETNIYYDYFNSSLKDLANKCRESAKILPSYIKEITTKEITGIESAYFDVKKVDIKVLATLRIIGRHIYENEHFIEFDDYTKQMCSLALDGLLKFGEVKTDVNTQSVSYIFGETRNIRRDYSEI